MHGGQVHAAGEADTAEAAVAGTLLAVEVEPAKERSAAQVKADNKKKAKKQ